MRKARNSNKKDFEKYGHHEYSDTFGVGVGSLRVRPVRIPSEGLCCKCGVYDERLYDEICPFCMSMLNDKEVGEWQGRSPKGHFSKKVKRNESKRTY